MYSVCVCTYLMQDNDKRNGFTIPWAFGTVTARRSPAGEAALCFVDPVCASTTSPIKVIMLPQWSRWNVKIKPSSLCPFLVWISLRYHMKTPGMCRNGEPWHVCCKDFWSRNYALVIQNVHSHPQRQQSCNGTTRMLVWLWFTPRALPPPKGWHVWWTGKDNCSFSHDPAVIATALGVAPHELPSASYNTMPGNLSVFQPAQRPKKK